MRCIWQDSKLGLELAMLLRSGGSWQLDVLLVCKLPTEKSKGRAAYKLSHF